jgi:double-strand break repair protein MRE11
MLSNLVVQLQEKENQSKETASSQNLQADTLSVSEKQKCSTTTEEQQALDSDDEPIESSVSDLFFSHHNFKSNDTLTYCSMLKDPEESGSQQAGKKRRAAPGGGGGGSAATGGRRKTDLASFQRIPAKEDDADTAKKRRAPVSCLVQRYLISYQL